MAACILPCINTAEYIFNFSQWLDRLSPHYFSVSDSAVRIIVQKSLVTASSFV